MPIKDAAKTTKPVQEKKKATKIPSTVFMFKGQENVNTQIMQPQEHQDQVEIAEQGMSQLKIAPLPEEPYSRRRSARLSQPGMQVMSLAEVR